MSSLDNEIVRRGYFSVVRNPRGGVLQSLSSKRQWVVLRKQSRGNPACMELYKNEDQTQSPLRIIDLDKRNFKNVQPNERKKAFILNLNDEVCMFQCSSRADMEDWCRDIQTYASGRPAEHRVPLGHSNSNGFNDDFSGVPDDETFPVRLRKSNTIVFSGPCLLEILKDFENNKFHIALFTKEEAPRLIVKWQIDHIRQYGSHQSAFKFESGRKSSTGVDWFILDTDLGAAVRIHRSVDYWAKHIVEQVTNRGDARAGRSGTLPGATPMNQKQPPSNVKASSSLPRPPISSTLSLGGAATNGNGMYQPIRVEARDQAGVYDMPDRPPKGQDKNRKPATPTGGKPPMRPPTSNGGGVYQSLDPSTSSGANGGFSTYESLNQGTRSNERPFSVSNQSQPRDPTYMGLNPQTQMVSDVYMGLDQARS